MLFVEFFSRREAAREGGWVSPLMEPTHDTLRSECLGTVSYPFVLLQMGFSLSLWLSVRVAAWGVFEPFHHSLLPLPCLPLPCILKPCLLTLPFPHCIASLCPVPDSSWLAWDASVWVCNGSSCVVLGKETNTINMRWRKKKSIIAMTLLRTCFVLPTQWELSIRESKVIPDIANSHVWLDFNLSFSSWWYCLQTFYLPFFPFFPLLKTSVTNIKERPILVKWRTNNMKRVFSSRQRRGHKVRPSQMHVMN